MRFFGLVWGLRIVITTNFFLSLRHFASLYGKKQQKRLPENSQLLKEMSLMIINIANADKKIKQTTFDNALLARCTQALG